MYIIFINKFCFKNMMIIKTMCRMTPIYVVTFAEADWGEDRSGITK